VSLQLSACGYAGPTVTYPWVLLFAARTAAVLSNLSAKLVAHTEDIRNAQSSHSSRKIRTEQPTAASERSTMPWPDSTHTGSRERRSFCTGCRPSEPPRRYSRRSPLLCPVRQTDRAVHAAGALSTCHTLIQAPQWNGAVFLRRRYTTGSTDRRRCREQLNTNT
jgi:hypothetical protein